MKNLANKTLEELQALESQWADECNNLEEELRWAEKELEAICEEIDKRESE